MIFHYLWPKINFKSVQEFPTVSLDFTKKTSIIKVTSIINSNINSLSFFTSWQFIKTKIEICFIMKLTEKPSLHSKENSKQFAHFSSVSSMMNK